MSSFGLPIGPQGVPGTSGTGGGFGQPSGVALGPATGGYGSVAGTHPGNTFQQTVGVRNNVRFQVQPQVTIAVKPGFPLPDDTRRKDYLVTINKPHQSANGRTFLENRRYSFVGQAVAGLRQVNEAIHDLANNVNGYRANSDLHRYLSLIYNTESDFQDVNKIYNIIKPLGVYNNRGTHDGQAAFEQIPNSNVGNILGVNISNYCFVRDIWGVDLRAGDSLELWFAKPREYEKLSGRTFSPVEIVPIAGCFENGVGEIIQNTMPPQYGGNQIKKIVDSYNANDGDVRRVPIGKVWATPLHHPFQTKLNYKNIVAHDANTSDSELFTPGIATDPAMVFKNIEVELCPCQMMNCV